MWVGFLRSPPRLVSLMASLTTFGPIFLICAEPTLKPKAAGLQMPPSSRCTACSRCRWHLGVNSHVGNTHWPQQLADSITTLVSTCRYACSTAGAGHTGHHRLCTKGYVTVPVLTDHTLRGWGTEEVRQTLGNAPVIWPSHVFSRSRAIQMLCFDSSGLEGS